MVDFLEYKLENIVSWEMFEKCCKFIIPKVV